MTSQIEPGLYENLLTVALCAEIDSLKQSGWDCKSQEAESTIRAEILARHVYEQLLDHLNSISNRDERQSANQIAIVNRLLATLIEDGPQTNDVVSEPATLLMEVVNKSGLNRAPIARPKQSLRQSNLLVNGRGDYSLACQIRSEIASADRIDLLCAFVRFSGLRHFQDELRQRIDEGAQVRVITSVYTGTTDRKSLDTLVEIGAKVKISYNVDRTRLHAKAWLLHRNTGLHTAYIGSSNLTHTAQVEGLEWNVRFSAIENPQVISRFEKTFEQYWLEPEFEDYDPARDSDRLDRALSQHNESRQHLDFTFELEPRPHQSAALEALESERNFGHCRNLVVAATGVGKTFIAAFDYKFICHQAGRRKSLLFVAHRKQILDQSRRVFQHVLRDLNFGEMLVGGQKPEAGQHVFASIQSLAKRIDEIQPDDFEIVIVDEFHHADAPSYENLLRRLTPNILLGLTATPERADGHSILEWFDGRIAYESRLWDALDQSLLCPFHYFGITDQTDLSAISFKGNRYVPSELDNLLTGDHMRARRIFEAIHKYVPKPQKMTALGFCAGVKHAHFMAKQFNNFKVSAVALDGSSPESERQRVLNDFKKGEIRVIFSVDLFNEGVDLPSVDTVLLLRPTESATVFVQQLGRGLRRAEGKAVLTVLDFVGLAHKKYRYEIRYQALLGGGTRNQVKQAIEADFPVLPPGCAIKLERLAKDSVLSNLKHSINNAMSRRCEDLRALGPHAQLKEFLDKTNIDLEELYARPGNGHCFTDLRRQVNFADPNGLPDEKDQIYRSIGRLIHVDDSLRLDQWRKIIESNHPNPISNLSGRNHRLGLMLCSILLGQKGNFTNADHEIRRIQQSNELRREFLDLFDILRDRIRNVPQQALKSAPNVPLSSHVTYSLIEIMAAFNIRTKNKQRFIQPQGGLYWENTSKTGLLFITLNKSEKDYSPTTLYNDYAIDSKTFHWMSPNDTAPDTPSGQKLIQHESRDWTILLFVRKRNKDIRGEAQPYLCLGPAKYLDHNSQRPINFRWKLEREMPAWIYQESKIAS